MMPRRFVTLDVFTQQAFAGNPLAVVLDAAGLDDRAMQTIAREFNLSETVFVLAPRDPGHVADIRIFTPGRELPFAGHPTVGTAVLLALRGHAGGSSPAGAVSLVLQERVGPVPCDVTIRTRNSGRAVFALPKLPEPMPADYATGAIAQAFGLAATDIGFDRHRPALFSAGVPFPLIPVATRAALDRLVSPAARDMEAALGRNAGGHAFLYCREPVDAAHHFHARMFAPGLGVAEDPATGSAVAAFAGALMAFDRIGDGRHRVVIEQGYAMGRPSLIELTLAVEGGDLRQAWIGGDAILVSEGVLTA